MPPCRGPEVLIDRDPNHEKGIKWDPCRFCIPRNGGAAKPVEQLLEDVAERLSVPRESVEQRLVVFLLSHHWLRTESDYHPDSEDVPGCFLLGIACIVV